MSTNAIRAEARKAFAKRDKLEAELRAVNAQLTSLKGQYMIETHVWGLREESFRQEANITKVAA
jgi:dynactin complex subunit